MVALAVIGGTGVYALERLERQETLPVATPFASEPVPVVQGEWRGRRVAFLARHGAGHSALPHAVNYRANVWALAQLRPARVVALNAVGSLDDRLPPGSLGLPDQLVDYTWGRETTFCGSGVEVPMHVDFTAPYDRALRAALLAAAADRLAAGERLTLGVTQGPRLETAAEIVRLGRDGCHLVGMTGMPEAVLARELGLPYASLCIVANWAAGVRDDEGTITMDDVVSTVEAATGEAWRILERLLASGA